MPVVPLARNTVDFPNPGTNARVDAPNMGAGGEMIGRALEGLGGQLDETAQVQQQINTIHDHAAIKEATNHILNWYTSAGYTGPNAYFSKDGRDAVEGQPMIAKGLDELIQQQRNVLKNPRQQQMFDLAVTPMRDEWATKISEHAATQEHVYDKDQSLAVQGSTGELARYQYINDPAGAEKQIDTGLNEVDRYWRSHGASPELINSKKLEYTSGIYKDIGTNLASQGPDGPKLAQAFLDQHGASMTGDAREAVSNHIHTWQDTINAQKRQADADARRVANEAKTAARIRATSAAGLLDSGLPMDPKTYATALTDAQAAEDVSLIDKLQKGQRKNTTMFAHRSETPLALQNDVNSLNAKITRMGTKADPNDIIDRDALQSLYNTSNEELKSNGLAWAAQHLGAAPEPLNIMDPNSVRHRVSLVQSVSNATGQQVAPLQPAEVNPFAQQWRAGDAAAKMNLVMRFSQFGPLAAAAAQQIAPNDNGLVHLIGLASHSNRGVAISRVNQAIAGYEAMKTEGKLVGKTATESDFNEWTGSALQFMPGAKDGVFTVAKALLAQDASQHGWNDQNMPDDKAWYRAVNSALGAYSRGSVQYGGIAGFNGAQTVLPENMSLDDFEGRVSRANDTTFAKAGNGVPVVGNGQPLNSGDLKRMHFVPIDDGVYRLENGGAFVHTKDGHPYEIDIRKLR
jgi:hypothetical protein